MKVITKEIAKEMFDSNIDSLKKVAIEAFPELDHEEKKWEDFGDISGYYIDTASEIRHTISKSNINNQNIKPTLKEAESDLALDQLRQWRDKANGAKLNEWCDWSDLCQEKYCVLIDRGDAFIANKFKTFEELTFKTRYIAEQFLKDHKSLIEIWMSKTKFKNKIK